MSTSRQLAAIMFTDIVGYTALMGRDENKAFHSLSLFKKIAQPLVENFHGAWHKDLGDGALMSFPNVLDAVHCAIAIQKEINSKTDFHLRMGIHLGDVILKDGDILGDGVNIASRIQSEATPGGICVSESVAKNIRNQDGMKAEWLGKRLLKNVDEPVMLYQLRADGLIIQSKNQTRNISLPFVILLIISTAIITALLVWTLWQPGVKEQLQVKRFNIILPAEAPLEFIGSATNGIGRKALALSPDGKILAYIAPYKGSTIINTRHLSSSSFESLPGTEGAFNPFFSPDGKWIGFFVGDKLKKTNLNTRTSSDLCRVFMPHGACWTDEGNIIVSGTDATSLLLVNESGGDPDTLLLQNTGIRNFKGYYFPSILPGNKHILTTDYLYNCYIITVKSGVAKLLPIKGNYLQYIPTGHISYMVNSDMYVIPFDINKMEVTGNPVVVLNGLRMEVQSSPHYGFDRKGTLIYAPGIFSGLVQLVWVNQEGTEERLPFPPDNYGAVSISPDGKKIASTQTGPNSKIIILELETGRKNILQQAGFSDGVRWFMNNVDVAISSNYQSENFRVYSVSTHNQNTDFISIAMDSLDDNFITDISRDGNWLAFENAFKNNLKATNSDLWIKNLKDPKQSPTPVITTNAYEWGLRFSPNAKFITYTSNASGRYEVYVQHFPKPDGKLLISNGGGTKPLWTNSGRQIFYKNGTQYWIVDVVQPDGSLRPGTPRLLFEGPYLNIPGHCYDIAADNRILMLKPVTDKQNTTELIVIENWFEELKRLAPVK